MKSQIKLIIFLLSLVVCGVLSSPAKERPRQSSDLLKTNIGTQKYALMNANNITSWARGDGFFNWLVAQSWNGEFPKGSGVGMIFAEGIVFGGICNDGLYSKSLRVTGNTYFNGLRAGSIITDASGHSTGVDPLSASTSVVFAVRPDMPPTVTNLPSLWPDLTTDAATFNQVATPSASQIAAVAASYFADWQNWPASKGAPWYIDTVGVVRNDAGFTPSNPHHIPGIPGASKTIWFVCNDLDETANLVFAGAPPLGIEQQMTMWAYSSSTPLNNIIFKQVKLIYKGNIGAPANSKIDSMYIVQWADPDNGDGGDDYAGSDSSLNLGYCYNSTTKDAKYAAKGLPAPASGYAFLQGAAKFTGNASDSAVVNFKWRKGYQYYLSTPLSAFDYFAANSPISDPDDATYAATNQWYNLMRGCIPRPEYPAAEKFYSSSGYASSHNIITNYCISGDPTTRQGWNDGADIQAGDRRTVSVHGPFTLALHDTAEVVIAFIGGVGADNLTSVKVLKYNTTFAQFAFNNLFVLPNPPPNPTTDVSTLDQKVILNWANAGASIIESSNNSNFKFQGYNVYQLPSPSADKSLWTRLATYDVAGDNVTVIIAPVLDINSGVLVTAPVQYGSESGIKRTYTVDRDNIRQRPLVNGQEYYFAVSAYSFDDQWNVSGSVFAAPFPSLESQPVVITAIPKSNDPGNRIHSAVSDPVVITHTSGIATATMQASVVDPAKITGHDYKVFISVKDSIGTPGNMVGVGKWNVVDVTKGDTLLKNSADYSFSNANPVFDGLQVGLSGQPYYVAGQELGSLTWTPSSHFNFDGVNATPYAADQFINSALTADQVAQDVQMEFDNSAGGGQNAYCFTRTASTGSATALYDGYYHQPFKVWELNPDGTHKRQIDFVFMEATTAPDGTNDHIWAPGASSSDREYWFFVTENYSPTEKAKYTGTTLGDALGTDSCVWSGWYILHNPAKPAYSNGDVWTIKTAKPLKTIDAWTFTTSGMNPTTSAALAATDVDKINVFPNPYYGMNAREWNRLNKFVKFNHLPGNATIRIFNLAGVLVRTIQKTPDMGQFATWNLRNEKALPVASGIYIVHVDMPDIGKVKILKLALVQEEQVLPTY